jgi:hypothetical protein
MECAICFDAIGAARVTLGCNHAFHINCIVGWFYQQNMNCELEEEDYAADRTASSCPCCRAPPARPLDDIPCNRLIRFIEEEDADGYSDGSSVTLENPLGGGATIVTTTWNLFDDEEIAAAAPRTRADTPPPPPVPRLDLTGLQVRWERTGPTSWERSVEVLDMAAAEEPAAWDGARTPSPPPDSLVEQAVDAARKIQALWRMRNSRRGPRAAISL